MEAATTLQPGTLALLASVGCALSQNIWQLIGFRALQRRIFAEAASLVETIPELPRLLHQRLSAPPAASDAALKALALAQQSRNHWLAAIAALLVVIAGLLLWGR